MKKNIKLKDGTYMLKLGQGTWYMGEDPKLREKEIEALQEGIRLGMTLLDTAEMYGEGPLKNWWGKPSRSFLG